MVGRSIKRLQTTIQIKWKCVYNALINILGPHNKHIAKWCRLSSDECWANLTGWPGARLRADIHPLQKLLLSLGVLAVSRDRRWAVKWACPKRSCGSDRPVLLRTPPRPSLSFPFRLHSKASQNKNDNNFKWASMRTQPPEWGMLHIWVPYTRLQQPLVFSPPSLNRYRSNGHVDVAFYIF